MQHRTYHFEPRVGKRRFLQTDTPESEQVDMIAILPLSFEGRASWWESLHVIFT